ncbi:MAG: hypothetical protein AAFY88_32295, partial [Acidobacteriota bacterium]
MPAKTAPTTRPLSSRLLGLLAASCLIVPTLGAQTAGQAPSGAEPVPFEKNDGGFCTGDLLLDQAPDLGFSFWSESTCENCTDDAQILAEDFFVSQPTLVTEVVIWGWYFPNNTPPPFENWTVRFHTDAFPDELPGILLASQVTPPTSRVATGRVGDISGISVDEQRWLLRLAEPVRLGAGFHWIELIHDSPIPNADTSIQTGTNNNATTPGHAFANEAPGESWASAPSSDLALQVCGTDARWDALMVPGFEIDVDDPSDTTLFGIRNTSSAPISVDVAYYRNISEGALRVDTFNLPPSSTLPR